MRRVHAMVTVAFAMAGVLAAASALGAQAADTTKAAPPLRPVPAALVPPPVTPTSQRPVRVESTAPPIRERRANNHRIVWLVAIGVVAGGVIGYETANQDGYLAELDAVESTAKGAAIGAVAGTVLGMVWRKIDAMTGSR